jgi:WD40 repeat protein/tetratricopeptide (TPR) repeat protein
MSEFPTRLSVQDLLPPELPFFMFNCPKCNTTLDRNDLQADAPACPHCGETLDSFGQETAATVTYNEPPSNGPPKPSVPGFEVGRLIGRGGMGEVWEGRQKSLGGRRVAIKVLTRQRLGDSNAVARFQHEAEALAALSHPNIVNVIDFCATAGSNCLIMEYVEGDAGNDGQPCDLLQLINEGKLDSGRTRTLIIQIAGALAYAHEKGIVHRDVKPANVMIDRFGNAKVADFGLAAIDRVIPSERLTVAGQAMGTPAYMAPEQFSDAKSVDHRADVFAAGIMLYEMLTGQLPKGTFVPPSEAVDGLDVGWDAIVARAMQPNREKRYDDMAEMMAEIESNVGGTTTAMPVTRTAAADSSAVMSHSDNTCYSCRAPVTVEAQFCDACGASLRFECPRCGAETRGGVKFCRDCGIDVVKVTQCQQQLDEADGELQAARVEAQPTADRFAHAERAGLLAARALKQVPDDERARATLAEANVLTVQLAAEAGETAYREKRLCAAIDFFQYIRDVIADHPIANKRLEEIAQYRKKQLGKAGELIKQGNYERAGKALESLATQFEEDGEISRLLDDCRLKQSGRQDARDRMRALEQDRKLFELEELLAELKRSATIVKGMEKYGQQLQEKLLTIRSELARARALLASGEYEEAITVGHWIIERAADCPEAEELVRRAREQIEAGSNRGQGRWLVRFVLLLIVAGGIGYATKGFWFQPEYKTVNYWVTLVFEGKEEPADGNPASAPNETERAGDDTSSADTTAPATDGASDETTGIDGGSFDPAPPTKQIILDRHKVGEIAILDGHSRVVTGVAFHPNGNSAVSVASRYDKVRMMRWDLEALKGTAWNAQTTYDPVNVTYSPRGGHFACFHYANRKTPGIAILDQQGKLKILLSAGYQFRADRFVFSPDGRNLLSAGADGHLRFWKDWKLTPAATSIKEYADTVRAVAFTPDGKYCVASSGYASPTIDVFDLSGRLASQFKGLEGRVLALTVSPDGRHLVSLDVDSYSYRSMLRLWDFRSNELIKKISLDESQTCGAFSRDARFAIIGGKTGTVTLYNVFTGERIISWRTAQGESISTVAISADSRFALSGGADNKVRYWGLPKVTQVPSK